MLYDASGVFSRNRVERTLNLLLVHMHTLHRSHRAALFSRYGILRIQARHAAARILAACSPIIKTTRDLIRGEM